MAQKLSPMLPKRGTIRFLALIFIFLISCTPASEIRAKPTKTSEQIIPAIHEFANTAVPSELLPPKPADSTGAVALDEPRPKIDPQLVEELKELKRQKKHQRVRILLEATDEESLEKIREAVQKAGGKIEQNFDIGDISVIEVQSDKVEELSEVVGVEQISTEKEYVAFLADRIPAFSIDTVWSNNITGKNVKIAILDTGVGPHDAINVAAAESFVSGEDTTDQNGHGTHVAGIAQGIAKDAVIYNAKVLNKNGGGTTSQILAGINWAVQQDADIISMSFGGMFTELDGPLASTVKEAIQNGVVFVVASGNCKQGCGGFYGVTTPGNVKEVITVGAVDDNNVVASFSSGDTFDGYIKPDVVAPGIDITSAWLNNGEKTLSGTSMSAPFAAGVTALLLEKEPGLTHEQVKQRLESTATNLGESGKDARYGSGLVSVSHFINNQSQASSISSPSQSITQTGFYDISPRIQLCILDNFKEKFDQSTVFAYIPNPCVNCEQITSSGFLRNDTCLSDVLYDRGIAVCLKDGTVLEHVTDYALQEFMLACKEKIRQPITEEEFLQQATPDNDPNPQELTAEQIQEWFKNREEYIAAVEQDPRGERPSTEYTPQERQFLGEHFNVDKKRITHMLYIKPILVNITSPLTIQTKPENPIEYILRKFLS